MVKGVIEYDMHVMKAKPKETKTVKWSSDAICITDACLLNYVMEKADITNI